MYNVGDEARCAAAEDITAALEAGALPVGDESGLPLTWFTLDDTGAAHDAVEQGRTGKVLVRGRWRGSLIASVRELRHVSRGIRGDR